MTNLISSDMNKSKCISDLLMRWMFKASKVSAELPYEWIGHWENCEDSCSHTSFMCAWALCSLLTPVGSVPFSKSMILSIFVPGPAAALSLFVSIVVRCLFMSLCVLTDCSERESPLFQPSDLRHHPHSQCLPWLQP